MLSTPVAFNEKTLHLMDTKGAASLVTHSSTLLLQAPSNSPSLLPPPPLTAASGSDSILFQVTVLAEAFLSRRYWWNNCSKPSSSSATLYTATDRHTSCTGRDTGEMHPHRLLHAFGCHPTHSWYSCGKLAACGHRPSIALYPHTRSTAQLHPLTLKGSSTTIYARPCLPRGQVHPLTYV